MSAISDLEVKVQSLRDQLRQAETSLLEARLELCPVKVNQIVESYKKTFKVSRIDPKFNPAMLHGHKKTKNGWHKWEQYIGTNWKLIEGETQQ